jgi:bacterioferritin-associated ferredoxin
MFVCCCLGVTDRAIKTAIDEGAESVEDVSACTGAGTRCGSCRPEIAAMVAACPAKRRLPYLTAASDSGAAHASSSVDTAA